MMEKIALSSHNIPYGNIDLFLVGVHSEAHFSDADIEYELKPFYNAFGRQSVRAVSQPVVRNGRPYPQGHPRMSPSAHLWHEIRIPSAMDLSPGQIAMAKSMNRQPDRWIQDPFLIKQNGKNITIIEPFTFHRFPNQFMAEQLTYYLNKTKFKRADGQYLELEASMKTTPLLLEGGNILEDKDNIYVGYSMIQGSIGKHSALSTVQEVLSELRDLSGGVRKKVIVVDHSDPSQLGDATLQIVPPSNRGSFLHIDLFMTVAPEIEGKPTILLADIQDAYVIAKRIDGKLPPSLTKVVNEISDWLSAIESNLKKQIPDVNIFRVPLGAFAATGSGSNDGEWSNPQFLYYNNCLVGSQPKKVTFYLPKYEYGHFDSINQDFNNLNKKVAGAFTTYLPHGSTQLAVKWIDYDFLNRFRGSRGGLRCVTKVLYRS